MTEIKMNLTLLSATTKEIADEVYQTQCIKDIASLIKDLAMKDEDELIQWVKNNFTREITIK